MQREYKTLHAELDREKDWLRGQIDENERLLRTGNVVYGGLLNKKAEAVLQVPQEIEGRDGFAIVRGSDTVNIQGRKITGNYIEVWQKQANGAWQITRKIWNTDQP